MSKAGRPKTKIEINFKEPLSNFEEVAKLAKLESTKDYVKNFAIAILELYDQEDAEVNDEPENAAIIIKQVLEEVPDQDHALLIDPICQFISRMSPVNQSQLFGLLGKLLNKSVYRENSKSSESLDLEKLQQNSKKELFGEIDPRLCSFINSLTERTGNNQQRKNNLVFKMNAVENLIKARNTNFTSITGLREHLVAYIASNRSRHVTQVFSKQGAKGTRPLLEKIMDNSMKTSNFKAPSQKSLFISFDNIQKLYKNYRLGANEDEKAIAAIVTSILCILPDGPDTSDIQYQLDLSPEIWLHKFTTDKQSGYTVRYIDKQILKNMLKEDLEIKDIISDFFQKRLSEALKKVVKEIDDEGKDEIEDSIRKSEAKKRRVCEKGHVNTDIQRNRKKCNQCKSALTEKSAGPTTSVINIDPPEISNDKSRLHFEIQNFIPKKTPVSISMGAVPINPNRPDRIENVLENIQKQCDMFRKFSTKLLFKNDGTVQTIQLNDDSMCRKFIVVTVDGLPFKQLIRLINDVFICAVCDEEVKFIADLSDHMKFHGHYEFYQKFGNILPNVGQFHYSLTMMRSYVKLNWDINYSELCKSINFESPKAQLVQLKVTDFHKSLDTFRIAYEAKLRELVYPFVTYAREAGIPPTVEQFYIWKKFFVKSPTYLLIHDIEEIFGTSFLLYHSGLRANNLHISEIAKKVFSPLFHVNNNVNYSIIDIFSEYMLSLCEKEVPKLFEYNMRRMCTNFTLRNFNAEPYDARHEEFNKRGINMFDIRNIDDFVKAFQLVDAYDAVKGKVFEDLELKAHGGDNCPLLPNYEPSIKKMRFHMRRNNYLNEPYQDTGLKALGSNSDLNIELKQLYSLAKKSKFENIVKVMRFNDFECGVSKGGGIRILRDGKQSKGITQDHQNAANVLIESEENMEKRELLRDYFKKAKKHKGYSDEGFLEDLLQEKFSYI